MAEASARKQPPRCTPVLLSPHDGPSKLRFLRRTHATRVKICTSTTHRCDKQDAAQSRSSPGADMIRGRLPVAGSFDGLVDVIFARVGAHRNHFFCGGVDDLEGCALPVSIA